MRMRYGKTSIPQRLFMMESVSTLNVIQYTE